MPNMPYIDFHKPQPPTSQWHWIILALIVLILMLCSLVRAEELKASWYSVESLKKEGTWKNGETKMANGKWYDENALTCATRLYPLGTFLCITNLENGKSVIIRVTDRIGKRFAKTRIDLSKRAFKEISALKKGIIPIKVEER